MHRRTVLAATAALTGASGCLSSPLSSSRTPARKTVSASDVARRTPSDPDRPDDAAPPSDLRFDVSVDEPAITGEATARLSLEYANEGGETVEVNLDPSSPDPVSSLTDDPGLVLLSDAYDPTRRGGCWKPEAEGFPQPAVAYRHPIEPGEQVTLAYAVWASPQQDPACIEPGEYAFDPPYGSFSLRVALEE